MKPSTLTFAAIGLILACSPAAAQRMYKCVDAKGKVYYTQVPPKECLGKETQELSGQGSVLKRNEGVLTPEQQAARDAERRRAQEAEQLAREERRKNQALLNTYSSENDIAEARARALRQAEEAIRDTEARIAESAKRRKQLESEKEFYAKKTVPAKLQEDIKNNEIDAKNQVVLLDAKKKEISTINAKYDEDLRRYRELTKGAAPKR